MHLSFVHLNAGFCLFSQLQLAPWHATGIYFLCFSDDNLSFFARSSWIFCICFFPSAHLLAFPYFLPFRLAANFAFLRIAEKLTWIRHLKLKYRSRYWAQVPPLPAGGLCLSFIFFQLNSFSIYLLAFGIALPVVWHNRHRLNCYKSRLSLFLALIRF